VFFGLSRASKSHIIPNLGRRDEQCSNVSAVRNWTLGFIVQTAESLATGFVLYSPPHLTADVSVSGRGFSVFSSLIYNKVPFRFPFPFVHDFFNRTTARSGPGSRHYGGFTITLRHTTHGTNPLDE
jgi:hypothetical protein